jgi:iron complex transport system substrate-binding protein
MTEESVETLYLIAKQHLIAGVSSFVERPLEAKSLPVISVFTHANLKKIVGMKPDLVLGFSDIQKDIAKDLIGEGLNVFIANHRSIDGILNYIQMLGNLVDAKDETKKLLEKLNKKISHAKEVSSKAAYRPRVYIEEWENPMICGIEWFSELVELCGGEVVHATQSKSSLAKDRILTTSQVAQLNPEVILACWCGKKVQIGTILERDGFKEVDAIKNHHVYELEPAIFLQPGPAPILDGIDILLELFEKIRR